MTPGEWIAVVTAIVGSLAVAGERVYRFFAEQRKASRTDAIGELYRLLDAVQATARVDRDRAEAENRDLRARLDDCEKKHEQEQVRSERRDVRIEMLEQILADKGIVVRPWDSEGGKSGKLPKLPPPTEG